MLPEEMRVIDEEIDIKEEPLFPPSEEDKVGWMWSSCCFCFLIIDRFELSSHYESWKLFWQISYRKDTLLKGVPNSCWTLRGPNSHYLKVFP